MDKRDLLRKLDDAAAVEGAGTMSSLLREASEAIRSHCVVWFDPEDKKPLPGQQILLSISGYVCEGYLDTKGRFIRLGGYGVLADLGCRVDWWTPMPKAPKVSA